MIQCPHKEEKHNNFKQNKGFYTDIAIAIIVSLLFLVLLMALMYYVINKKTVQNDLPIIDTPKDDEASQNQVEPNPEALQNHVLLNQVEPNPEALQNHVLLNQVEPNPEALQNQEIQNNEGLDHEDPDREILSNESFHCIPASDVDRYNEGLDYEKSDHEVPDHKNSHHEKEESDESIFTLNYQPEEHTRSRGNNNHENIKSDDSSNSSRIASFNINRRQQSKLNRHSSDDSSDDEPIPKSPTRKKSIRKYSSSESSDDEPIRKSPTPKDSNSDSSEDEQTRKKSIRKSPIRKQSTQKLLLSNDSSVEEIAMGSTEHNQHKTAIAKIKEEFFNDINELQIKIKDYIENLKNFQVKPEQRTLEYSEKMHCALRIYNIEAQNVFRRLQDYSKLNLKTIAQKWMESVDEFQKYNHTATDKFIKNLTQCIQMATKIKPIQSFETDIMRAWNNIITKYEKKIKIYCNNHPGLEDQKEELITCMIKEKSRIVNYDTNLQINICFTKAILSMINCIAHTDKIRIFVVANMLFKSLGTESYRVIEHYFDLLVLVINETKKDNIREFRDTIFLMFTGVLLRFTNYQISFTDTSITATIEYKMHMFETKKYTCAFKIHGYGLHLELSSDDDSIDFSTMLKNLPEPFSSIKHMFKNNKNYIIELYKIR